MLIARPSPAEHAPYAVTYIDATARALAAQGTANLGALLAGQPATLRSLLQNADPELAAHSYAPGKWTLAESLVHVVDTERVFAYRLLRIARGDATPLPGFDQDAWVPESRTSARQLSDILTEIEFTRSATLALMASLDLHAWAQIGTASAQAISTRALAWMIAGHFHHHVEITRDRYLTP